MLTNDATACEKFFVVIFLGVYTFTISALDVAKFFLNMKVVVLNFPLDNSATASCGR